MSKLSAFLHPVTTTEEKEIIISKRFQDEKGNPIPFKIRSLTQEENDAITKKATRQVKVNGQPIEKLDNTDYTRRVIVAATLEPDFTSTELCEGYGVMDPLLVPGKILLSGEYSKLGKAIMSISGFDDINAEEAAKN